MHSALLWANLKLCLISTKDPTLQVARCTLLGLNRNFQSRTKSITRNKPNYFLVISTHCETDKSSGGLRWEGGWCLPLVTALNDT